MQKSSLLYGNAAHDTVPRDEKFLLELYYRALSEILYYRLYFMFSILYSIFYITFYIII